MKRIQENVNNIVNQLDLIDIQRKLDTNTAESTLFLKAQGTLTKMDHISDCKINLSKSQNSQLLQKVYYVHNIISLEINNNKIYINSKDLENKQQIAHM